MSEIYSTEIVIRATVIADNEKVALQRTLQNVFENDVPISAILSFEVTQKARPADHEDVQSSIVKL